jgi:hypothetical protein
VDRKAKEESMAEPSATTTTQRDAVLGVAQQAVDPGDPA